MNELDQRIQEYENYIAHYGITDNAIDAYVLAARVAYNGEYGLDRALQTSGRVKGLIEGFVKDQAGYDIWQLDSYCQKNKTNYSILDRYYDLHLLEAPHRLHSYLIYLEKDREEKERFYLPKMAQLNKHGLVQAMQDLEDDKLDILTISMPPGTQKCQPLNAKVLTPNGFVEMRDVSIGTKVIDGEGNLATVVGVSPIKKRPMYDIIFDDGSKVRCSDNHLWKTQTRDDRRRGNKYRIAETKDMLKNFRVENGKRSNYSVDYVPKINFPEKRFLIHPYIMGALLGDGGLSQVGQILSTKDVEIVDKVNELLPKGYSLKYKHGCDYRISGHEGNNSKAGSLITKELKRYELQGYTSIDKFIPKEYLYSSHEQRLWLLRGLMDTDGNTDGRIVRFSTISTKLAEDVVELVHSLGGYASVVQKKSGYKADGVYKRCNDVYSLTIEFSSEHESPFYLSRKADKYKPKRSIWKRYISDIVYVGEEECKCIMIDNPCHLYITNDYIITHNTTFEKFFSSWIIGRHPKDYSLFFSHSSDITRMFYDGVLDITTSDEYRWSDIFPEVKLRDTNAKAEKLDFGKYKPFYSLQCTSVGSKNSGKVRCNRYLYCDDLIGGIEEALNKTRLDNLWNIYSVDARQRKLNEQVKEIHIATRWSVHDVIGRLKMIYGNSDRARFIAVPDIDPETGESNFNYKYNGMSAEFFHDQALVMDDISYRCLYKNEPIEREGLLYSENELRRYSRMPDREPDAIIGVCDTKSKGIDFMVLPVFYQYDSDFYMADCICDDSSDYGRQYERLANIILEHKMQQCEFESNAGGDRVAHEINKMVEDRGGRCNITTKATETNKETRIIVNSDWIKKHCLFKMKEDYSPKSDYGVFMSWLLSYSVAGKNTHDDVCDCLANFALYVTKRNTKRRTIIMESLF